jgi:hypothetical protein
VLEIINFNQCHAGSAVRATDDDGIVSRLKRGYLVVCLLRFCRNRANFSEGYALAENAAVRFRWRTSNCDPHQMPGKTRGANDSKTSPQSHRVSVGSRCSFVLLTLKLDENHVQRFIANVLRGVRQRLAKQNFARLQLSFGDFAI